LATGHALAWPAPSRPGRSGPGAAVVVDPPVAGGSRQTWRTAPGAASPVLGGGRAWRRRTAGPAPDARTVRPAARAHAQLGQQARRHPLGVHVAAAAARRPRLRRRPRPAARTWPCRGRGRRRPSSAHRSLMRASAERHRHCWRISAAHGFHRAARVSSAAAAWPSAAGSRHCQSDSHRSAGCTRSAPAKAAPRRTAGTAPPATPACRPAGRQVVQQRERRPLDGVHRGVVGRPRHHALHGRFRRRAAPAAAGRPTSSSAPTPWCSWCARCAGPPGRRCRGRSADALSASFR
jgi:hypothetical protein